MAHTRTATLCTELFSRLQSFSDVQARDFARHPDCTYRFKVHRGPRLTLGRVSSPALLTPRFHDIALAKPNPRYPLKAAVAFTFTHISVCYLPEQ